MSVSFQARNPGAGAFYSATRAVLMVLLACVMVMGAAVPAWAETLQDGTYSAEVALSGGSGRAWVKSPCELVVKDGSIEATVVWSSSNYDLMVVDGQEYRPVTLDGGSTFTIPVETLDVPLQVQAETLAMSQPHTIDYTLTFSNPAAIRPAYMAYLPAVVLGAAVLVAVVAIIWWRHRAVK
ncbi:MAG: hypothetical protein ACOX4F_07995 [Atopobiaceae bacterium]|jgi:hypothetical protein